MYYLYHLLGTQNTKIHVLQCRLKCCSRSFVCSSNNVLKYLIFLLYFPVSH